VQSVKKVRKKKEGVSSKKVKKGGEKVKKSVEKVKKSVPEDGAEVGKNVKKSEPEDVAEVGQKDEEKKIEKKMDRKNVSSRAYHKAKAAALSEGKSKEDANAAGRAASQTALLLMEP